MSSETGHAADILTEARCLGCAYPLRGLVDRRCPECGQAFDPTDPLTMRCRDGQRIRCRRFWLTNLPIAAWAGVTLAAHITLMTLFGPADTRWENVRYAAPAAMLGMAVRKFLRRRLVKWDSDRQRRSESLAWKLGWVIVIAAFYFSFGAYRSYSCPHASYVKGIGPLGIAHSGTGGPCRNFAPHLKKWRVVGDWYLWWSVD